MKYRPFGKLNWNVSALSLGTMRLPAEDTQIWTPNIKERESLQLIRHAIDHGINYIDTAWPYHGGKSEEILGRALREGYRGRVKIATKCPTWLVKEPQDFERFLDEQLRRLQTDHIDFYLLHALDRRKWENIVLKFDLLARAEKARAAGKIQHLGFSFHDDYAAFEQILTGYHGWEFCQIQYNYMDTNHQAGARGLHLAAARGIPVIVMEPVLGGRLASPPPVIRKEFDQSPRYSPAEWALQWIWNQPEVTTVLSGMSNLAQLDENLAAADRSAPNSFSPNDHALIERVTKAFRGAMPVPCTQCQYCMPCPHGIDIPTNFKVFNDFSAYQDHGYARALYARFLGESARSSACIACGECEERCPQKIPIANQMKKVTAALAP